MIKAREETPKEQLSDSQVPKDSIVVHMCPPTQHLPPRSLMDVQKHQPLK